MNSTYWDGYPHFISAKQCSREFLERHFLPLVDDMEDVFKRKDRGYNPCEGKRMVSFFYQPSTRTRMSFERAMDCLGGRVMFASENAGEFSSAKKGETLADTIRVINRYRPDVIVLRYDKEIGAKFAAEVSGAPIINAGDRDPGDHPTQALLDLRTIFKHRGSIDGLKIAFCGDPRNGRTIRALSYFLGKFMVKMIYYVSPVADRMKDDVKEYLAKHDTPFEELLDLREVASEVDVVYQTRAQVECGTVPDRASGYFIVDRTILDLMRKDAIIMHPLPRIDEITPEVDADPRAVYLTAQVDSGLFARMALLKMILAP